MVMIGLCLVCVGVLLCGCTQVSKIQKKGRQLARELPFSGDGLKRTLAVGPVENLTPYRNYALAEQLKDRLSQTLREGCPRVLMPADGDGGVQSVMAALQQGDTQAGRPKNLVLAEAGRQAGLNAILTAAVTEISATRQEKGILWYRDTYTYLRVQIAVVVYDTATGAKLLDETTEHRTQVDEMEDLDPRRSEELMLPWTRAALDLLAESAAERVCERLSALSWRGFIVAREADRLVLSSGAAIGLKPGTVLEIFDDSATIEGAQGQKFFLPGLKTGEAKVSTVSEWQAEATLLSGEGEVETGHSVKLK
ncbi:MAG: hypothetical protein PVI27_04145 [Desulfobacteraceae bacterium]